MRKKAAKKKSKKKTSKAPRGATRTSSSDASSTVRKATIEKRAPSPIRKKRAAAKKSGSTRSSAGTTAARAKKSAAATAGPSAKPKVAARRSPKRPGATTHDPVQFQEERKKLPKSPLGARQLREFKDHLLRKRAELLGDVEHLTDEALRRGAHGHAENSTMPIHMADLGSDNWEQEFTLGLIANEQTLVREIDEALQRIKDKTYGVCLATHEPIGLARLQAKPWARYCIEYARAREEGRAI